MTTSWCLKNQKGFSLIEVIVSILLVGMIAVFAGMGITALMDAFMLTKTNAETTQKAQVAMTRMVKEFTVMSAVTAATATSITFTSYKQGVTGTHTLSWTGSVITYDGDVLVDNVNAFELGYYNSHAGPKFSTWLPARKQIGITLKLTGANNNIIEFTDRVVPRNL